MSEAGHNCVGACEIDSYARRIYAKQFPGIRIWEDATKINPKEVPDFDVLTGGFPCQAFSIAGKRKGFEDTRGSMFFEIARIAKEKRPRYLLLENVKGLLNHDSGNTFRVIISTLDEMGYDAEWQVLNSKYFVPQNRERVFIVGHLRGERTRKIFPLGENNKQATKPKLSQLNETSHNTEKIQHSEGFIEPKSIQRCGDRDKKTYSVKDISHCLNANPMSDYQNKVMVVGKVNDSQSGIVYNVNGIAPNLNANGGGMGAKTGLYAIENNIKKIGNKNPSGIGQSGNVYDTTGIAPALCSSDATRGFNSSGYIAVTKDHGELRQTKDESLAIDANYWKGPDNHGQRTLIYLSNTKANMKQRIQDRSESWTLTSATDFGVIEPVIVADRSRTYADKGRSLESPKKICNSLTSVAKDNYVMQNEKPIKEFGIVDDDGRKISNAIRQGGRGSVDRHSWDIVNDKMRIRRLTPKECERLQGFPDDWTKYDKDGNIISDTQRYKCCGNAVTVPVVKFVAENLG